MLLMRCVAGRHPALQEFTKAERVEVDVAVQEAIAVIRSVLVLGMEKAMSGQRV